MIVASHQPNYIPWIGYFYKIYKSDIFVISDNVQYIKKSYINRNKIKTPDGFLWLTIPVDNKLNDKCSINQIKTKDELNWKKEHLKKIEMNYKRAKYFMDFFELLENLLLRDYTTISDLNISIIKNICKVLKIDTKIILSSELNINGKNSERLINICKHLNADTYFSGNGARKYQNERLYSENNIKLVYSDFKATEYTQLWGEFLPNMSIVDYIFNCGHDIQSFFEK